MYNMLMRRIPAPRHLTHLALSSALKESDSPCLISTRKGTDSLSRGAYSTFTLEGAMPRGTNSLFETILPFEELFPPQGANFLDLEELITFSSH